MEIKLTTKEIEIIQNGIDALIVKRLMSATKKPADQDPDEMAAIVRLRDRLIIPPR